VVESNAEVDGAADVADQISDCGAFRPGGHEVMRGKTEGGEALGRDRIQTWEAERAFADVLSVTLPLHF